MRGFENLDVKFCWYVLKKYKFLLLVAGVVIALVATVMYLKPQQDEKKDDKMEVQQKVAAPDYLYDVIQIQAADTLYGEAEAFYREYDSADEKTCAKVIEMNDDYVLRKQRNCYAALACLKLPHFMQKCRALFIEKTKRDIPLTLRVQFSLQENWIISTVDLGGAENKEKNYNDAVILAELVTEEAVKYLSEQKFIKKAERVGKTTESGIFLKTKINGAVASFVTIGVANTPNTASPKNVSLKIVLLAIFSFFMITVGCFTVEFLRNPVVSNEDVQRSAGVEVFKNLDNSLYQVAAGRKMREILSGRKILTLVGEIDDKAVERVGSALRTENNSVCTIAITNKPSSDAVANYFQASGQVCDMIIEDRVEINSELVATKLSVFYDLQEKLSERYDVVLLVLDALQNMPELLPPQNRCVIICAMIGKSKNYEIAEMADAVRLGGAEIGGAVVI